MSNGGVAGDGERRGSRPTWRTCRPTRATQSGIARRRGSGFLNLVARAPGAGCSGATSSVLGDVACAALRLGQADRGKLLMEYPVWPVVRRGVNWGLLAGRASSGGRCSASGGTRRVLDRQWASGATTAVRSPELGEERSNLSSRAR